MQAISNQQHSKGEFMKYDVSTPFLSPKKEQVLDEGRPVTMGDLITMTVLANLADDSQRPKDEKLLRFNIAKKVQMNGPIVAFSDVETVLIRDVASKVSSIHAYGSLMEFLDSPLKGE